MNMAIASPVATEESLGEQFRSMQRTGAGGALAGWREARFSAFQAEGLPTRRLESWHYTDLRALVRNAPPLGAAPDAATLAEARRYLAGRPQVTAGHRVVIVDGLHVPDLSDALVPGFRATIVSVLDALAGSPLPTELASAEALGATESVVALNGAFLQGGVVIDVEPGAKLDRPVELLMLQSGRVQASSYGRCYVRLGDHASATILERHAALNQARCHGHHVMIFALADGASLDHVAIVDGLGPDALHIGSVLARLGADARLESVTEIATPGITRRQSLLDFVGRSSEARFSGVSLLEGRCHADTTLVVTHTAPGCESRELYKHILDEEATGIYQGKVVVAPGAQKTDGKMLSKAIFLSEGATMYNKPELEIFADDVVCGHGATVGSLDEDQLFYLRARGIPLREAQAMLLEGFAAEVIEGVAHEPIRDELSLRVAAWLRQHGR